MAKPAFLSLLKPQEGALVNYDESGKNWFDENGFYCTVPAEETKEVTMDFILRAEKSFIENNGGKKICWLCVVNPHSKSSREVRAYIAEILPKHIKAMAMICPSALAKMTGNLFFRLNPQQFPSKIFNTSVAAKSWLKEYI